MASEFGFHQIAPPFYQNFGNHHFYSLAKNTGRTDQYLEILGPEMIFHGFMGGKLSDQTERVFLFKLPIEIIAQTPFLLLRSTCYPG